MRPAFSATCFVGGTASLLTVLGVAALAASCSPSCFLALRRLEMRDVPSESLIELGAARRH